MDQEDNDVLAYCTILMFLTLAFLDDAFEDVSIPQDLFGKTNPGSGNLPIPYKADRKPMPVLRGLEGPGSTKLSPTLALSAATVTAEFQRVCIELGYPRRFTTYCIRRAFGNSLDGKEFLLLTNADYF